MSVAFAAALLMASLQACSSVPDAANPVEWYKGARDWMTGEDTSAEAKKAEANAPEIPGKDKPFPEVSSVPEAPKRSSEEERNSAAESLIADRENARYTDEVIRRQSVLTAPPRSTSAAVKNEAPIASNSGTRTASNSESRTVSTEKTRSAPKTEAPSRAPAAPVESRPRRAPPPMRAEAVPPPPRTTRPAPPPMRAEAVPPPRSARRVPPSRPDITQQPSAPSRPPVAAASPVAPLPAVPPAPPPVAPPAAAPSQLVFGPPPSDIALLQEPRREPTPDARRSPAPFAPSAPVPAIPAAPDPASLDPASQVAIVTFGQGSAKLSGTARRIVREVVEMQRQRGGKLYVIGHSSSWTRDMNPVRHNMINFGLSLDRANTVAKELLRLGLTTGDLSIGAMSDARPLFFEIMPSGEAGNRRVEIFLDGG